MKNVRGELVNGTIFLQLNASTNFLKYIDLRNQIVPSKIIRNVRLYESLQQKYPV